MSRAINGELPNKATGSADTKREYFVKQAKRFNLGLLIIDEMQNVLGKKYWNLVDHFLTLSNELMVPIVFVGTPEIVEYFKENCFRLKRRAGIEILVHPYERDIMWDSLIEILWHNQWLSEYVPLTQEFKDVFFEETGGVIDRVVKLFKAAQRTAILKEEDTKKRFTPNYIRMISKQYFGTSRDGLNKLADENFSNALISEADLYIPREYGRKMITGGNQSLENEYSKAIKVLTDTKTNANKIELEVMKNRVLTDVKQYCKHCPDNFTEYEVDDAMKMVFGRKKKISESEEELTDKIIKLLYEFRNGIKNCNGIDLSEFTIAKKGEL